MEPETQKLEIQNSTQREKHTLISTAQEPPKGIAEVETLETRNLKLATRNMKLETLKLRA